MRKGLTVGSGRKGYYNVQCNDPRVHSQSAQGIKQPQRVPAYCSSCGGKQNAFLKESVRVVSYVDKKGGQSAKELNKDLGGKYTDMQYLKDNLLYGFAKFKDTKKFKNLSPEERNRLNKLERKLEKIETTDILKSISKKEKTILVEAGIAVGGAGILLAQDALGMPISPEVLTVGATASGMGLGELKRFYLYEKNNVEKNLIKINKQFPNLPESEKKKLALQMTGYQYAKGGKLFGEEGATETQSVGEKFGSAGASIVAGIGDVVSGVGSGIKGAGQFVGEVGSASHELAEARKLAQQRELLEEIEQMQRQEEQAKLGGKGMVKRGAHEIVHDAKYFERKGGEGVHYAFAGKRYDGLGYGRKIREFSSKQEAEQWKEKNKGKIFRGKRYYTIPKSR